MLFSLSNSMSCLRVSNAEYKSSSNSYMDCPVSSELHKSSNKKGRWFQYYGVYGMRFF